MLRPYVCVACEKVILDNPIELTSPHARGPASLINLFSKITITPQESQEIPANAVVPKEWAIYAAWFVEEEDKDKHYSFCMLMHYPEGQQFGSVTKIPIPVTLGERSQVIVKVLGFPIGQQGFYRVKAWLEESDKRVGDIIEIPIELAFEAK